jgi:hypothetical protein
MGSVAPYAQLHGRRWYDPASQRWLNQDPSGLQSGDANLYRYCGNGPTGATDPGGLGDLREATSPGTISAREVPYPSEWAGGSGGSFGTGSSGNTVVPAGAFELTGFPSYNTFVQDRSNCALGPLKDAPQLVLSGPAFGVDSMNALANADFGIGGQDLAALAGTDYAWDSAREGVSIAPPKNPTVKEFLTQQGISPSTLPGLTQDALDEFLAKENELVNKPNRSALGKYGNSYDRTDNYNDVNFDDFAYTRRSQRGRNWDAASIWGRNWDAASICTRATPGGYVYLCLCQLPVADFSALPIMRPAKLTQPLRWTVASRSLCYRRSQGTSRCSFAHRSMAA